jgi:hypothetical protein
MRERVVELPASSASTRPRVSGRSDESFCASTRDGDASISSTVRVADGRPVQELRKIVVLGKQRLDLTPHGAVGTTPNVDQTGPFVSLERTGGVIRALDSLPAFGTHVRHGEIATDRRRPQDG